MKSEVFRILSRMLFIASMINLIPALYGVSLVYFANKEKEALLFVFIALILSLACAFLCILFDRIYTREVIKEEIEAIEDFVNQEKKDK